MAAKPEVLITSLLQKIETSFQSQNGTTKLATCTRPQPTANDIVVCRISKMAGNNRKSGELSYVTDYCRRSKSKTGYA